MGSPISYSRREARTSFSRYTQMCLCKPFVYNFLEVNEDECSCIFYFFSWDKVVFLFDEAFCVSESSTEQKN